MKKKLVLRRWVEYLLITIAFLSFCIMGSECEDMFIFIVSHLIATGIFILSSSLLIAYARKN